MKQKALAEQQELALYRAIFNHAVVAQFLLAADGLVVFANDAAGLLFGYAESDLKGETIDNLLPGLQPEKNPVCFGLELEARHKDGRTFPAKLDLSELRWKDESLYIAIVRDNTANVDMQQMQNEALLEALNDLEDQREQVDHRSSEIDAIINTSTEALVKSYGSTSQVTYDRSSRSWRRRDKIALKHANEISVHPFTGEKMKGVAHSPLLYDQDPRLDLPEQLQVRVSAAINGADDVIVAGWMEH